MIAAIIISAVVGFLLGPPFFSAALCKQKNRNPWKGFVLGCFFSWFAVTGLWLALKERDPETGALIA